MSTQRPTPQSYKMFVYGTLRSGFHNHGLLQTASHIGLGSTVDKYQFNVCKRTRIPHVVFGVPDGVKVIGELYEVPTQAANAIHMMEVQAGYTAKWRTIELRSGIQHRALIFEYNRKWPHEFEQNLFGDYREMNRRANNPGRLSQNCV